MAPRLYEFFRFCIVGGIGFLTDAGCLELFVALGFTPPIARIFSIAVALQVTYVLHTLFTFRGHGGFSARNWATFLLLNLLGAAINYAVFLGVLACDVAHDPLLSRQCALLAGTAIALGFNYASNKHFVFTRPKEKS